MNLTTLSELKKAFHSALEEATDKQYLIENELREINNFISYVPIPKVQKRLYVKYHSVQKGTEIFDLNIPQAQRKDFTEAFNSILRTGEFQIEKSFHEPNEAFEIRLNIKKQAFEFAEYYRWLNELKSSPQKASKKNVLTHKQKLLALHYLGLDTSKFDNSAVAKILSEILELSEDNTRQYLSYISAGRNNVRTKTNLEKVNQLFEEQGLTDISKKIKSDIEKI
ncbi:hypothetical protein [Salinimicrobium terrae]|uniref:hypothetical protein n=1 Tax=Salinimicrobium terrae TaxID=470866 RepID=UPI00040C4D45|nr:hypothetical protein [Salinimicrobium terrae]